MATAPSSKDVDVQLTEHAEVTRATNDTHTAGHAVQAQERNRTYWQALTKDPRLLLWVGVMLWTLIVRGFENQASGVVLSIPVFRKTFGKLNPQGKYFIETAWQSALGGGGTAATMIGLWFGSYFSDIIGTKATVLSGSALNVISVGIEFGSTSIGMFFAGRALNKVAIGVFLSVCTSYIAEVSPLAIRASLIGFSNLAQGIGPLFASIMVNYTAKWTTAWSWKALIASQWGFAAIAITGQILMPESPVFLIRKGKIDEARKSLNRMYSDPGDVEGHLQSIQHTLAEAESQKSSTYMECFRGTNLRRTLIAIGTFQSEPQAGLAFVGGYGALMYQMVGIADAKSFQLLIVSQITSMLGAFIAMLLSDLWGRRPMFIGGCLSMAAVLLSMAIGASFPSYGALQAQVAFYTMYGFFYNVGVGSTVYAIAGEISTSILRSKTIAIAICSTSITNTIWSFAVPPIFNADGANLKGKIGYIFGAFMFLFALFGYFYVPETRLRSYAELDEMFMAKVPARQFKKYVTVSETRAAEAYEQQKVENKKLEDA